MSEFGFYSGQEFFEQNFKPRDFLIDQILHEKDSVILAGKPKAGKSVLLFNLICALTSGDPFLDRFDVARPCKVVYVQLEGSMEDSQDRFKRMIKAINIQKDNFGILYSSPLRLHETQTMNDFITKIENKMGNIDVVIIDPIYFAMMGTSLSDDTGVRDFTGQLRILQEHFDCAVILTHHFKKARHDKNGNIIAPSDDDIFGSVFFQAWITHQFLFDVDKSSKARTLQCNVQRSGKIIEKINMKMVEPDPLYFEILQEWPQKADTILKVLEDAQGTPLQAGEVIRRANIGKSTFYRELKSLYVQKKVYKDEHNNYFVNNGN